ncbi:hypothetical protein [Salinimicrobium terrae]|uniref:hypothetical protein n=1 Tax=Salinimicrobium terrae TaxID=470866 RepID=UPI00146E6DD8|nr:hypothetical protein [Salinimicrobium terrae]
MSIIKADEKPDPISIILFGLKYLVMENKIKPSPKEKNGLFKKYRKPFSLSTGKGKSSKKLLNSANSINCSSVLRSIPERLSGKADGQI